MAREKLSRTIRRQNDEILAAVTAALDYRHRAVVAINKRIDDRVLDSAVAALRQDLERMSSEETGGASTTDERKPSEWLTNLMSDSHCELAVEKLDTEQKENCVEARKIGDLVQGISDIVRARVTDIVREGVEQLARLAGATEGEDTGRFWNMLAPGTRG